MIQQTNINRFVVKLCMSHSLHELPRNTRFEPSIAARDKCINKKIAIVPAVIHLIFSQSFLIMFYKFFVLFSKSHLFMMIRLVKNIAAYSIDIRLRN